MGGFSAGMRKCNLRPTTPEVPMATRKKASHSSYSSAANDAGKAVSDSAQKIWLAGLGAYERAKAEGPKMFDTLVEQGKSLGGKAREAADQAMRTMREGTSGAAGRFDKLEPVFEDRVSKSLRRRVVVTRGEDGRPADKGAALDRDVPKLQ